MRDNITVYVGLPGSGKSTIANLVGGQWRPDCHYVKGNDTVDDSSHVADTDIMVTRNTGKTIPEIFSQEGEEAFRRYELGALQQALHDPQIEHLSVGGGIIETAQARKLLQQVRTIYLAASVPTLVERVEEDEHVAQIPAGSSSVSKIQIRSGNNQQVSEDDDTLRAVPQVRPLFRDGNVEATMRELYARRHALYEKIASHVVTTDDLDTEQVSSIVSMIIEGNIDATIHVPDSEAPYTVYFGKGLTQCVADAINRGTQKVMIVHPQSVLAHVKQLQQILDNDQHRRFQVFTYCVPDGEQQKHYGVAQKLWGACGDAKLGRTDTIIGLGGGATTDLAGFIAATWLRGIHYVSVPTSLLGMVDAGVGGKTGINSRHGKNLIGSFYRPQAVVCDTGNLNTLPHEHSVNGYGEIVKCGFIADQQILSVVERTPFCELFGSQSTALHATARAAIAVKADVVSRDLREGSIRENLNYGHTFGHALEKVSGYRILHGHAVAVGMMFAAYLAHERGMLTDEQVKRHQTIISHVGLPVRFAGASIDDLMDAMLMDKKVRSSHLRFVLLDGIGHPVRQRVDDRELLRRIAHKVMVPDNGSWRCQRDIDIDYLAPHSPGDYALWIP
ncbi:MAG: 3-dehydroquinate synthase [Actinomycetaceae bacterium]|nr:3-dehydroquinate synthase [Actinomycetaceae bacterium]